jgi:hypothetical protein
MLVLTRPGPAGIGRCERCGDDFGKDFADDRLCRRCEPRPYISMCERCGVSFDPYGRFELDFDLMGLCDRCAGAERGTVQ